MYKKILEQEVKRRLMKPHYRTLDSIDLPKSYYQRNKSFGVQENYYVIRRPLRLLYTEVLYDNVMNKKHHWRFQYRKELLNYSAKEYYLY